MKKPELLPHEEHRLAALQSYAVLDTAPEMAYDDIVKVAAMICEQPVALISLVDRNRQWFKATEGLEAKETPREISFCAHAIQQDQVFEIPNASLDDRFHDNPMVTDGPKIRFYAGAPLIDKNGMALGTLCVASSKPGKLTEKQTEALAALARQVTTHIETRKWAQVIAHQQTLLAQSARMSALGQMAGGVAHEVNTPLCSLTLGIDLIGQRMPNANQDELAVMKRSAMKISGIIQNLLSFARGGIGSIAQEMDLFRVIETTTGFCQEKFKENGVELILDPSLREGSFEMTGDASALSEVLTALLNNAYDAVVDQGGNPWVKVMWRKTATDNRLIVMDSGFGIPDQYVKRLMEPFFTTKAVGKGVGMGLSLSKNVMEKHGGQLLYLSNETQTSFAMVFPPTVDLENPFATNFPDDQSAR